MDTAVLMFAAFAPIPDPPPPFRAFEVPAPFAAFDAPADPVPPGFELQRRGDGVWRLYPVAVPAVPEVTAPVRPFPVDTTATIPVPSAVGPSTESPVLVPFPVRTFTLAPRAIRGGTSDCGSLG